MRNLAAIVATVACVSGCSGTSPRHDEPDLRTLIQPVEMRVYIPQADLFVRYEASVKAKWVQAGVCLLYIGFCPGTIGLRPLVDSELIKRDDARAGPLKDAVADIPFARRFGDALTAELSSNDMRIEPLVMVRSAAVAGSDEEAFIRSAAGAVVFMNVDYAVSADFSRFELVADATAYPRSEGARRALGLKGDLDDHPERGPILSTANAFYRTTFRYEAPLPSAGKDANGNALQWQGGGGALIREAVTDAIEQATHSVARDFGTRLWVGGENLPEVTTRAGMDARLVEEVVGKGRLLRINGHELLFEATLGAAPGPSPAPPVAATVSDGSR
jgi:hypothetical protein